MPHKKRTTERATAERKTLLDLERAKSSRLADESAEKDRIIARVCSLLELDPSSDLAEPLSRIVGERAALRKIVELVEEPSAVGAIRRIEVLIADRARLVNDHATARHETKLAKDAHAVDLRELDAVRAKLEQLEQLHRREREENSIRLESFARDLGEARRGLEGALHFIGAVKGRSLPWR